jgi:PAS domain S-box-containing protein
MAFSTLQDAELAERGYILTGSDEFLQPFEDSAQALDLRLKELDRGIVDPESRTLLAEINRAAREHMTYLREVNGQRRTQGPAVANDLVRQQIGKRQMDQLRDRISALRSREKALLIGRLQSVRDRSVRSERVVWMALCSAILVILAAGALLVRHTRRRLSAEDQASRALALLSLTMDNVTQGIAVFSESQKLLAWNKRYLELRGIDASQVTEGMTAMDILRVGPVLEMRIQDNVFDTQMLKPSHLSATRPFDGEATRSDGTVLLIRGRPIESGYYILTYTDVTALKLSESAYRDQATRLASILDSVVDAIITINESGSIESWSKGAERLFGYRAEEVLRRNVRMLMPDPHSAAHDGYLRHYQQTGERRFIGQRREVEALHKDGHRIAVDLGLSEMRIGTRRLFIGIVRDISARREVERLKSGFVSTVSHELRTPLTSISGSLGLLAGGVAGTLPTKATRLIEIAKLNCERLVRLINDILDLERAEAGKLDFRLESQPLKPIVQHAIDLNRAYAHTYGATIELDPRSDDAHVLVDRDRLIQVLTNILSNAAKFSPRGAEIHVAVEREGDVVRISVRDEGPGIAPEFQARIFQKFAQADSSDSRSKSGTGLGLSIARSIIERLGGGIGFESEPGRGTTFYVRLPIRAEPAALARPEPTPVPGAGVLICEDDPDVAQVLGDILRDQGMRADVAPSAAAARVALLGGNFSVALIDLHLPDGDGLDFITQLRAQESTRALPVIVMTAGPRDAAEPHQMSALRLADWLQKPIDPRRLLDAIHLALAGRDGRSRILHVEDDESLTQLLRELLLEEADVVAAHSLAQARLRLDGPPYDLVILDLTLGDGSGLEILPLLRYGDRIAPPVILYTASEASGDIAGRVQAALVKSRDPVEKLLANVRALAGTTRLRSLAE